MRYSVLSEESTLWARLCGAGGTRRVPLQGGGAGLGRGSPELAPIPIPIPIPAPRSQGGASAIPPPFPWQPETRAGVGRAGSAGPGTGSGVLGPSPGPEVTSSMGTLMGSRPCHPPQPPAPSHQLQAYVAWVNSQLKKKPGVRPVQDLRQDLRDGVTLALLIEIVAGEKLSGIELKPSSQQEMKENVEKVLQFVASKKIRMHQTSAKDIIEGNLKSTMRLILALAAHFKPGSGRAGSPGSGGRSWAAPPGRLRPRSAAAVAQGAAAALADVRQDVQHSGRDLLRHRHRNSSMDEEIENPCWSVRALVQQYEGQQNVPLEPHPASLTSPSPVHSAKSESTVAPSEEKERLVILQAEEAEPKPEEAEAHFQPEWQAGSSGSYLENSWEEQLLEQQDHLEKEMEEAKKMISGLQALLLNGSLPEDEQEGSFELSERGACPEEQLIIIRSRLDQSVEENQDLKKELLKYKQEARNLQGIKDALQQRLLQQDASVLQLKQELLRANMDKEELHNQNVDLQRKVEERNRLLAEYKKELCQKDRHLQQQQTKLDEMLRELSEASYQQVDLERELEHREALLAHCMKREAEEVMAFSSHSAQSNGFLQPAGKGAAPAAHRGPQEQLQWPRPAAPHHRQPGAGHLQPHGAPAPHGDAQEAGEEGAGEITSKQSNQRVQRLLASQIQAASLSEHACDEHQCLHQSVVLHRPLPHPLHGQHTKEVRGSDSEGFQGCHRSGRNPSVPLQSPGPRVWHSEGGGVP
ncbi:dixin isoform X5 [Haemorhous mexicanus]|uniref:dixin isoform X5 n=1 Tax=Haemorhous mexicanus TaxID=30427 RepID=UPI0028BE7C53|nr:dixin isoform X5 [Haemorhous mexicanus]